MLVSFNNALVAFMLREERKDRIAFFFQYFYSSPGRFFHGIITVFIQIPKLLVPFIEIPSSNMDSWKIYTWSIMKLFIGNRGLN